MTEVSVSTHSGSDRCQQWMLIDYQRIDYQCQTHCYCHCGRAGRCRFLWKKIVNAKRLYTTQISYMENGCHFRWAVATTPVKSKSSGECWARLWERVSKPNRMTGNIRKRIMGGEASVRFWLSTSTSAWHQQCALMQHPDNFTQQWLLNEKPDTCSGYQLPWVILQNGAFIYGCKKLLQEIDFYNVDKNLIKKI